MKRMTATDTDDIVTPTPRDLAQAELTRARARLGVPVDVEIGETGRTTLVFRLDWRVALRVLNFCRELDVVDLIPPENKAPPIVADPSMPPGEFALESGGKRTTFKLVNGVPVKNPA